MVKVELCLFLFIGRCTLYSTKVEPDLPDIFLKIGTARKFENYRTKRGTVKLIGSRDK
jgi:hypothetical protein